MNYHKMVSLTEANRQESAFSQIAVSSTSAINNVDGVMRWLEDKQVIQFVNPQFKGKNAEFSIVNRPFQKIWFSQLSSQGVTDDFNSPLLDEIILKNQTKWCIVEKFKTAAEFWEAVKGRKFIVSIKGKGFCLNKDSQLVKTSKLPCVLGTYIAEEKAEKSVFEYIRQCVNQGKLEQVKGTLKNKTAYLLTEI